MLNSAVKALAGFYYNRRVALVLVAVLAIFGWLMISRRLAATLVLPLAALSIAILALVPVAVSEGILPALGVLAHDVIESGVTRLSTAIMAVILGAVLAALMDLTGAAERLVRYAAEYAGENRFQLGLMLLCVIAVLFTTLGGLGAVILVASVTLPLLFSLGFEPKAAGGLFLLGLSLGGCLNPINWALYKDVLELKEAEIVPYAVALAVAFFLVACAFLAVHTVERNWSAQAIPLAVLLGIAIALGVVITILPQVWLVVKHVSAGLLLTILALLVLLLIIRTVLLFTTQPKPGSWLMAPGNWLTVGAIIVPLLLLLWSSLHQSIVGADNARFSVGFLTALAAGILFAALASLTRDGTAANRVMRALFDGVTNGGPAVVLLIGIGLLLKATMLDEVTQAFRPLFSGYPPGHPLHAYWQGLPIGNALGFITVFFVLSPLALYRGPLNLYGMGSGVVGIIKGSAILSGSLIMVAFFSVGMLQGVCDPTNTHNVWIANFCKVPVGELTRLTLPWVLAVVLIGLGVGVLMFGAGFG